MRLGFERAASYVAARDFRRGGRIVKAGELVEGSSTTLRMFYRRRKINKTDGSTIEALAPVEEAPEGPYKVGSQWAAPGTDEKFSSKKKAQEWLDDQDWLSDEEDEEDGE